MQDPQHGQGRGSVARRGVLAGVAAVLAGALARASERVAQAANNDPLILGQVNTATATSFLFNNQPNVSPLVLVSGTPSSYILGSGVSGSTGATGRPGVYGAGTVDGAYGVRGDALGGLNAGVRGNSGADASRPGAIGVLGVSDPSATSLAIPAQAAGVYGLTNGSAAGVIGQSNNGVGMQGSSTGNVGVLGTSSASHGLYGSSTNGYGLYATSTNSTGIVASTNNGNAIQGASNSSVGVLGSSNSSVGLFGASGSGTGVYGTAPPAGYAARFDGRVLVNGDFTAIGGAKSGAVPHPDGTHRRLYAMESPESWFEDFGSDRLINGRARVRLDPDFDVLVRGDHYQVFLTPEGDCKGLYVSAKNPHAFEVRELQGGTSSLAFSYRVVAKRKDIAGPRLERVEVPGAPLRPGAPQAPPAVTPLDPPHIDPTAAQVVRQTR